MLFESIDYHLNQVRFQTRSSFYYEEKKKGIISHRLNVLNNFQFLIYEAQVLVMTLMKMLQYAWY
jgi:hypothetical protein